jgi:hypothetical protein
VPYSSDLEKTKIMALRERPHNKVVCLWKMVLIKENKIIHHRCHHYCYLL